MRVNLGALDGRINGLIMDLEMLDRDKPPGYQLEVRNIQKEIAEIEGVKSRAIQHGTGYYDTRVLK